MKPDLQTDATSFEAIRTWLEKTCAIHYPPEKRALLQQRIDRAQRNLGLQSIHQVAQALARSDARDVQLAVMHAASTNHTYFYREKDVLGFFLKEALPILAKRSEIKLWSAACSTGDEVYTLAILIAETLGIEALKRTHILGTDISAPVIETAEAGIFPMRQLEQVPVEILRKYMHPVGINQYRINDEIRAACTFRRMNLKKAPYPFQRSFQAVFCRNVLYYFTHADQVDVVNSIADVTEQGGWLFTSVTENVRDLSPRWQSVTSGISRKIDGAH
jgi:chemotaxis protein methyltransferase CheR